MEGYVGLVPRFLRLHIAVRSVSIVMRKFGGRVMYEEGGGRKGMACGGLGRSGQRHRDVLAGSELRKVETQNIKPAIDIAVGANVGANVGADVRSIAEIGGGPKDPVGEGLDVQDAVHDNGIPRSFIVLLVGGVELFRSPKFLLAVGDERAKVVLGRRSGRSL